MGLANLDSARVTYSTKYMIRSPIGAVNCANRRTRASAKVDYPESNDKAVAQMSFVSQITLAIGAGMCTDFPLMTQKRQPKKANGGRLQSRAHLDTAWSMA